MTPMCLMPRAGPRFIPIPKNASTSIIAAMFGLQGTPDEIHALKPERVPLVNGGATFAVIRNPADRFISTWANKVWRPHRPDTGLIRRHGVRAEMSLGEFVDLVEERGVRALDAHIRPQVDFLPAGYDKSQFGKVTPLRFERLMIDWMEYGCEAIWGPLGHMNESSPPTFPKGYTSELWSRITRLYIKDMMLWESLK